VAENHEGINKPQKSHFRSEFSMGQLDFERMHQILLDLDNYAYYVGIYDRNSLGFLDDYYSLLKVLYRNMAPLMSETLRDKYNKRFEEAKLAIQESYSKSIGGKIFIKANIKLEKIHNELLETRQFIGLGITVSRRQQASGKMKNLLGLKKRDS